MNRNIQEQGVIDAILAYSKQNKMEIKLHIEDQKQVLNNTNFFPDNNPDGIVSKELFLTYLSTVGGSGLKAFDQFLCDINQKVKLDIPMFSSMDKKGIQYYWISQRSTTSTRGYKLIYFDGIERLIAAYQYNLFKFELTLEGLFEEAKNA